MAGTMSFLGGPELSTLAKAMGSAENFAAFGHAVGRVFWSGYRLAAMDEAAQVARGTGGRIISQTRLGD